MNASHQELIDSLPDRFDVLQAKLENRQASSREALEFAIMCIECWIERQPPSLQHVIYSWLEATYAVAASPTCDHVSAAHWGLRKHSLCPMMFWVQLCAARMNYFAPDAVVVYDSRNPVHNAAEAAMLAWKLLEHE